MTCVCVPRTSDERGGLSVPVDTAGAQESTPTTIAVAPPATSLPPIECEQDRRTIEVAIEAYYAEHDSVLTDGDALARRQDELSAERTEGAVVEQTEEDR